MKKKLILLFILILVYFLLQVLLNTFGNKHSLNYSLKVLNEEFNITEEYNKNIKNNYYINIIHKDNLYSYQWEEENMGKHIIKDIKFYKDENIECILPIFKDDKILFDVTCNDNNNIQYFHNMENISEGLSSFVESIGNIYSANKFKDANTNIIENNFINISKHNLLDNKIISIETYKGIINIGNNKKDYNAIELFEKDQYKKDISGYTSNYYIVADYNQNYEFNKFYIVNLKNNEVKKLKFNYHISFDSYIQGIDGDIVYLFDMDNKEQYKIDCKNFEIEEIGNLSSDIKIYQNGKWIEESVSNLLKDKIYFDFSGLKKEIINDKTLVYNNNFIYMYKKSKKGFTLYKSNLLSPDINNHLFEINDINSVIYVDEYIFFKKDDYIAYYNDKIGLKKIIQSNELFFNNNILYTVINK